ncbi:MAG: HYR domain-containing protein, partial [Saprospiraceae bacterium]
VNNIALVSSGDNCGVDTTYYHLTGDTSGDGAGDASGTTFNLGTTTVTYYVEDAAGNVDSCSFDVTVQESLGLVLTCPSNASAVNDAGQCSAVVNGLSLMVMPQDSVQEIFYQMTGATPGSGPNDASGTAFNVGTTTVTYTAVSNAGDFFTCSFTVQVQDTEPPAFLDCPMVNTTVGNSPNMCGIKFAGDVLPLATDNCPNLNIVYSPTAGTVIPLGTTTISAVATDAAGNMATCSFDLIVVDNEAPQIVNCPADISIDNDQDNCSAIVPWTEPTATDNCSLLAFTPSQGPNTSFAVGVTPVEYVAVDDAGNVSKCNFNVTVVDSQAPSFSTCPGDGSVNTVTGECYAIGSWTVPAATDNCEVVSLSSNLQPGDTLGVGPNTVSYTATDPAGNMTTCSFVMTVVDNEFPTITGLPGDITLDAATNSCGTNVTWTTPSATDNCGIDAFTSTVSSGDFFAVGTTQVDYVASDVNGNVTVGSFFVTVEDNVPPALDCPADAIVSVDGTVLNDPSGIITGLTAVDCDNVMLDFAGVVATDDCGVASIVQTQGLPTGSAFGLGTTVITYLATDNNGNQATCSFAITVGALPAAVADAFPLSPCEGESVFFSVNEYPGATYTWKDPNGAVVGDAASFILSGLTATQGGIYTVDISLPFNCSLQSSVEVVVAPNPQVEASSNDLLCMGGLADLQLTASDLAGAGITDWIWEYPDGTFAFGQNQTIPNATVDDAGTYTVTGITANGCASTTTIEVVISNSPVAPTLFGTDAAACTEDAITLNGQTYFGNSVSYHWSASPSAGAGLTPINNPIVEVNPTVAGDYTYNFYVVVDGCTSDIASWAVNVQAPPALSLSVDGQTECVNGSGSITLMETGGEASSWTWTNANGDVLSTTSTATIDNVTAANSDVYEVTAATTNGCVNVASLPVTITNQPPDATLMANVSELCTGDAVS